MTTPASISVECPMCKEETLHEVLSGKMGGKAQAVMDSTVKCRQCGHVHHVVMKCEKPVEIPVIISWLTESKRSSISLGPDEVLCVEDEIMCGDEPVLITSIEAKGARPGKANARDIQTIWGKKFEKVRVPFSINYAGKSHPEHVMALPDEEFFVGDMIAFGNREVVIHTIKTAGRVLRTGGAPARDIVRVYGNIVRKSSY